jgi:hypothetical protein
VQPGSTLLRYRHVVPRDGELGTLAQFGPLGRDPAIMRLDFRFGLLLVVLSTGFFTGCSSASTDFGAPLLNPDASGGSGSGSSSSSGGSNGGSSGSSSGSVSSGSSSSGGIGGSGDASASMTDATLGDSALADSGAPGDDSSQSAGDGGFVGPVVPSDCPGDPTQGWTEYADTFHLEFPFNLKPSDRYTFANGIHTFWVFPNDMPHAPGNTTAPRTEAHWTNFTTGQHMWTGDVLFESGENTVVFQVHTTATGAGPVYIRVVQGNLHEFDGTLLASGVTGKWFNLKVAFDAPTSSATIWINNCQKLMLPNSRPGSRDFYFKNGVYTCIAPATICKDHYKNIHLYQK